MQVVEGVWSWRATKTWKWILRNILPSLKTLAATLLTSSVQIFIFYGKLNANKDLNRISYTWIVISISLVKFLRWRKQEQLKHLLVWGQYPVKQR